MGQRGWCNCVHGDLALLSAAELGEHIALLRQMCISVSPHINGFLVPTAFVEILEVVSIIMMEWMETNPWN